MSKDEADDPKTRPREVGLREVHATELAVIERGNAAPAPISRIRGKSLPGEEAARLRRLAIELGRAVDA